MSLSGQKLASRFALTMSLVLAVVMVIAGAFLYSRVLSAAQQVQENTFVEATRLQGPLLVQMRQDWEDEKNKAVFGKEPPVRENRLQTPVQIKDTKIESFGDDVKRTEVMYGSNLQTRGQMFLYKDTQVPLLVPATAKDSAGEGLLPLIVGVTLFVILAGAFVAYWVGSAVSRPLELIVHDIAQISRGDLRHRTRVRAGGEIMLLAKSIDRMAGNLEQAQEAQLELSVRERELSLAGEVREALLPSVIPGIPGFDLGALHIDSTSPGGDFYEFIELEGGKIGLLVCDVSGRGIPGAMIGAIARSYLRVELVRGGDVAQALVRVNAELARDVRRGMYVTALYVIVDPAQGIATVACAGHKMPLIRYAATDKKIRLVQPEGIALGFDQGPVFTRTLQVQKIPIDPGDRIVIREHRSGRREEQGGRGARRKSVLPAGAATRERADGRDARQAQERARDVRARRAVPQRHLDRERLAQGPGMNIAEFQKRIEDIYYERDASRGLAGTHMWFCEEVGELTRALRRNRREELEGEFADVLAWLATLASIAKIDLQAAAEKKYGRGCPRCHGTPCKCA
jgi:NTP pyrophosphatase (non-canonical NTP hydrolase)/HAMP domain-containing protein